MKSEKNEKRNKLNTMFELASIPFLAIQFMHNEYVHERIAKMKIGAVTKPISMNWLWQSRATAAPLKIASQLLAINDTQQKLSEKKKRAITHSLAKSKKQNAITPE